MYNEAFGFITTSPDNSLCFHFPTQFDGYIVFLDAHAQGNLDSTWKQLFGFKNKVYYITELPQKVCCDVRGRIPVLNRRTKETINNTWPIDTQPNTYDRKARRRECPMHDG